MNLRTMKIYCTVVEFGVMAKAAEELDITPAAVSRTIADLEVSLGTKLLNRTTRKLGLTERGIDYYDSSLKILHEVNELHQKFESESKEYTGSIKIAAPMVFGQKYLAPVISQFQKEYPNIKITVGLQDTLTDLIEYGYDLGIRIQRKMADSSLVAKKFQEYSHHIVCHPDLLKKYGKVTTPSDLKKFPCISYSIVSNQWVLKNSSKTFTHNYKPVMIVNNSHLMRELVLEKTGICQLPSFVISEELKSGKLIELLPKFKKVSATGWLVYPSKKFKRPAVTKFSEFFLEYFNYIESTIDHKKL